MLFLLDRVREGEMIGLYTVEFLFFKLYIYDILYVQICLLKIMGIHFNTLELHWARPCVGRDHRQWPGPPRGAGDHVRGRRLLHRAHQREADAIAGRCGALTIAGRASDARARCLSWLRNTTVLCGGGDALETVAAGAAELFNVVRTSQQSSRRLHLLVQLRKRSCRLRRSARLPWRAACRKRGLL